MSRVKLQRERSLIAPEVQNPFVHRLHLSTLDKFQIAVMSVTLLPIRLLGLSMSLVIAWMFAAIALWGRTEEDAKEPMTGWRSWMRPLVVFFSRGVFFMGGFHWVTVKGKRAMSSEAPVLATSPHSSYFDALPVTFMDLTTVVAKSSAESVPFFGTLTRFTQPVFVSREDPNSRQNTIKEIKRRAQTNGAWPQIIIFPEGTCTNRKCLITYKPGAFYPAVPVQPVCIRYPNFMDTYTWTWEGPTALQVLWYTMCQFHNKLEIEFLPVYNPSEEEKADPKLYGQNVRAVMAKALGVPVTDHSYEDCRLMNYAAKLDMPAAVGLVEFNKISKKLGMNLDAIKEVLERFRVLAQTSGENQGAITLQQFAEYLDLPVSKPLEELFNLIDRDGSGTIDFREYVIGLHLVTEPANTEDIIQFAFQLFDKGDKGYISQTELHDILNTAFGMEEVDVAKLFSRVDADEDGKITYEEFKAYAEMKPEYARLFTAYVEQSSADQPGPPAANVISNGTHWCTQEDGSKVTPPTDDTDKVKAE